MTSRETRPEFTFVGTNCRGCFVQHAVNKLMAIFGAEGFRQFDSFVNRNFVRNIVTFRQLEQGDTQYRFLT